MAHNRTKSDDKQLLAAIQGGAAGQNTDGDDEKQQLDAAAAAATHPPRNPEYAAPTAGVTAEFHANMDINTQSEPDSNTSNINSSTSLAAETDGATRSLDYTNNRNFVTSSGQTIAEAMQQKQEIFSHETKVPGVEEILAAQEDSVGNSRPRRSKMIKQRLRKESTASTAPANSSHTYSSELGISRVETVKQQMAYTAATSQENNGNEAESVVDGPYVYATDNVLGLSRSETVKQQSAYQAATLQENNGNEAESVVDGPYVYATDNVLGLSRSETVKQQSAYQAATLQENDALMSSGEQFSRIPAPGLITNDNNRAAISDLIASPGPAIFVANRNNEIESAAPAHGGANEEQEVVVHAVMVVDPSDDERPREELPLANATKLVPVHKQFRVWIGGVAVLGIIVALIVVLLSVGNQPPGSPSSNEESQQNALVQISNVLASENWTKNDGWGSSSSNMCSWYGVVCDTDGLDIFVTELNLAANNLTGDIDDATLLGNLQYLERLDLDSNSIVGNLTAFSFNLIQFSHLKYVDLRLTELTGSIPPEVCDSMEGVDLHVDCGIECDCCSHDVLCEEECMDVPGWHDRFDDDCAWYAANNFECESLGSCCENDGHTANTACCVCGGGIKLLVNPSPSSAPSSIPTQLPSASQQPSRSPSYHPTLSPSVSQQPSRSPSHHPTSSPSVSQQPSESQQPSQSPSHHPTSSPSVSQQPSQSPSVSQHPSVSIQPTTLYQVALVVLYDATNGDEWNDRSNWLSVAPVCDWYGIWCNNDDDVIWIDLGYNNLQGSIPSELGLMSNLEDLALSSNSLTGSIPSELGLLTDLEYLRLYDNSLTGSIPSELGLMSNLEDLDLEDNSLTGSIPSELGLLTDLEYLALSSNSLTGSIPSEMGLLTKLERLYLFDNSLTGTLPNEVCALRDDIGGNLRSLWADCLEVTCTCCTNCY